MFYVAVIVAALAKAVMDRSEEGTLIFNPAGYWHKNKSWQRKWRPGSNWTVEAFPMSTTALVFLTDGWHLAQFVFLNAIIGSIFLYDGITRSSVLDFVIVSVGFRVVFEATYRSLKG